MFLFIEEDMQVFKVTPKKALMFRGCFACGDKPKWFSLKGVDLTEKDLSTLKRNIGGYVHVRHDDTTIYKISEYLLHKHYEDHEKTKKR